MQQHLPNFLESNLSLLKRHHPELWGRITENSHEPAGTILTAPNGQINLCMLDQQGNQVLLHHHENPSFEEELFLDMVPEDFTGVVTMVGMGLGYGVLALLLGRPGIRNLVVFEPNMDMFAQAIRLLDLTPLLSDPKVTLSIGPDQPVKKALLPATRALQLETIQNLQHLPSWSLNFDEYKDIYDQVYEFCNAYNLEGSTVSSLGLDFFANRLKHFNTVHHQRLLAHLSGKFKDIPAIMVSSGPSLDKNVHLLAQAKGKAVIIAADSALPTLIAHGVMPDFLCSIDPLEVIFEKVADCTPKVHNIAMICMSWVSAKMAKLFPADQIFWGFGSKAIEHWMSNLLGSAFATAGASSVAHLNLTSAIVMGCSPIVFIGQDLAFSQSKSYSSNTILQNTDETEALLNDSKNLIWLDGIDGEKVPSKRSFLNHKLFFEHFIKEQPGLYINATEGGANIEGTRVMPLQEVLDRFCTTPADVQHTIQKCSEPTDQAKLTKKIKSEFSGLLKEGQKLRKTINKVDHLSLQVLKFLEKPECMAKPYRSFNALPVVIREKITEIDKLSKALDQAHKIWPLMEEVTMAGLRESERQKHVIDSLANNPDTYVEWIVKNLVRHLKINEVRMRVLPLLTDTLASDILFLQKEEKLLRAIQGTKSADQTTQSILELIRLYFEADNLALVRPWTEQLANSGENPPELQFYQGCLAAHYTEFEKAEELFAEATAGDPSLSSRIAAFREQQGDAYIRYADFFASYDKNTVRRLLIKGLRYAPDHKVLQQRLTRLSIKALEEIKTAHKAELTEKWQEIAKRWAEDLAAHKMLSAIISPERAAQFHRYHAEALAAQDQFKQASSHLQTALSLSPYSPELHIALTDMYFASEEYSQGIHHLNQAIQMDTAYAIYWEEIGETLLGMGQHSDALAAFENCYALLPERIHLLKKIGDCYHELGQLEAAREAYAQLHKIVSQMQ